VAGCRSAAAIKSRAWRECNPRRAAANSTSARTRSAIAGPPICESRSTSISSAAEQCRHAIATVEKAVAAHPVEHDFDALAVHRQIGGAEQGHVPIEGVARLRKPFESS
jgi:hypothetical protein